MVFRGDPPEVDWLAFTYPTPIDQQSTFGQHYPPCSGDAGAFGSFCREALGEMYSEGKAKALLEADEIGIASPKDGKNGQFVSEYGYLSGIALQTSIRQAVLPEAHRRILDKGIMKVCESEFPASAIREFNSLLLGSGPDFNRHALSEKLYILADNLLDRVRLLECITRRLGEAWCSDETNFVDVTIACSRIQYLIHVLERDIAVQAHPKRQQQNTPMVEIATISGEQHTMMTGMLNLLYSSVGWQTTFSNPGQKPAQTDNLSPAARTDLPDIICFSWSSDILIRQVDELLSHYNWMCKSVKPMIIAGGPASERHVAHLTSKGVDCICDSIYAAVNISERYMSLRKTHHRFFHKHQHMSHSAFGD